MMIMMMMDKFTTGAFICSILAVWNLCIYYLWLYLQ